MNLSPDLKDKINSFETSIYNMQDRLQRIEILLTEVRESQKSLSMMVTVWYGIFIAMIILAIYFSN